MGLLRFGKNPFKHDRLTVEEAKVEAAEKARAELRRKKGKPESFRLRYTGQSFNAAPGMVNIHLVPILDLPLYPFGPPVVGKDECPTCNIIHTVKTHHLWLDGNATCLVSRGVYDSILKAGLEVNDLELAGGTDSPPPLTLNGVVTRREVDQKNEAIKVWP